MSSAIVYTEFGGPEVLTLVEVPTPEPAAGEVVVRIEAAGVNPIDWKVRKGLRATEPLTEARRSGADAAGIVSAVGDQVDGFRVGDAVVVFGASGTYATVISVRAENVQPRPPQVGAAEGAALGVPVGTAYQTLRSLAVGPSDTLLLHGGSGSVGQAVIQLATLWGARVIATSSERRADRVRALGATPVVYGDGLADRVRAVAPQGVTAAIDAAGTDEAIQTSLSLVADRDRIATLVRGRDAASFGIRAFSGGGPRPLSEREQGWRREAVPVTLALMAAGRFSVELGPTFALADAGAAQQAVEDGTDGKVTLVP
jgi:NADPH2:quinone reductase